MHLGWMANACTHLGVAPKPPEWQGRGQTTPPLVAGDHKQLLTPHTLGADQCCVLPRGRGAASSVASPASLHPRPPQWQASKPHPGVWGQNKKLPSWHKCGGLGEGGAHGFPWGGAQNQGRSSKPGKQIASTHMQVSPFMVSREMEAISVNPLVRYAGLRPCQCSYSVSQLKSFATCKFLNLLPSAHEPLVFDHTSFAAQPERNYKLGCDEYLDPTVGVFQSNKI